jgi:hypothetical protein
MYISRLPFHVVPGKSTEVEKQLSKLRAMIQQAGGQRCRVLRTHFASDGAPDLILEQEVESLAMLEEQIEKVTQTSEFQQWSQGMSMLLARSPKREAFLVVEG